ncbi:MAG: alpha/beta hydrolase [Myxococcales bacterium]|nr:alpha/beta hydrolase [Myxococcales bacterium]
MPSFTAPQGHQITYECAGSGTPVLLIMGFATPASAWSHQLEGLQHRHQVIAFDNRGVSGSGSPAGPWLMADFAADALALLDHLGHARAHVVGQSMGGMIAQHVALQAPQRIASLALLATHAGGPSARNPPLRALPWLLLQSVPLRRARVAAMARLLFPAAARAGGAMADLAQELDRDYGGGQPSQTISKTLRAMRGHDTGARLAQLSVLPVLVMRPDLDILIEPSHSDHLHQAIAGSKLVGFADAGHGAIRQNAIAINTMLLDFFAEAQARSAQGPAG